MAIQYYRHILDKDPGQRGLRAPMAFALTQLGEIGKAEQLLREECRRFPRDREPLVLLSYLYYRDGDCARLKDAVAAYDKLIQQEFQKAGLEKTADDAERKALLKRMARSRLKKEPNLGLPYYALGYCLKRSGQFEQAGKGFEQASAMGYDAAACLLQLVDIALEAGDGKGTLSLLRNAGGTLPATPESAFLEGVARRSLGDDEEAIRAFRLACDLKPHWSEALKNLARLQISRGETTETASLLARARALSPGNKDVLKDIEGSELTREFIDDLRPAWRDSFRGGKDSVIRETDARFLGLIQKGSLNEAADYLSRFLALHEREAVLSFKLANLLNELGRYEESSDLALKVIELENDHKAAWDLRGDILFRIGDFSHSIQAYREVVRIAPDDAMGHYNLGCAQDAAGDAKQAEVNWRRVLELEEPRMREAGIKEAAEGTLRYSVDVFARPPSFHAHLALGRLYVREGSTAQAIQELGEAIRLVPSDPDAYFDIGKAYMGIPDKGKAAASFTKYLALGGKKEQEARASLATLGKNY